MNNDGVFMKRVQPRRRKKGYEERLIELESRLDVLNERIQEDKEALNAIEADLSNLEKELKTADVRKLAEDLDSYRARAY